jgi:ankyrin repeat protein
MCCLVFHEALCLAFAVEKFTEHQLPQWGTPFPGSKDKSGRTPLSWAAQQDREAVVKLLLANDHVNQTPRTDQDGHHYPRRHGAGTRRW